MPLFTAVGLSRKTGFTLSHCISKKDVWQQERKLNATNREDIWLSRAGALASPQACFVSNQRVWNKIGIQTKDQMLNVRFQERGKGKKTPFFPFSLHNTGAPNYGQGPHPSSQHTWSTSWAKRHYNDVHDPPPLHFSFSPSHHLLWPVSHLPFLINRKSLPIWRNLWQNNLLFFFAAIPYNSHTMKTFPCLKIKVSIFWQWKMEPLVLFLPPTKDAFQVPIYS